MTISPVRASRLKTVAATMSPYSVVAVLAIEFVLFGVLAPTTFLTRDTLSYTLSSQAPLLIATLGLTLTLVVSEFDLTVGAILVFTDVLVGALTVKYEFPLTVACAAAVAAGTSVGVVNAFLVVRLGINSFVATLGMSTLLTGLTLAAGGSTIIADIPQPLVDFTATEILGLPLAVYYAFGLALLLWYVYEHTPVGRRLYFTGANVEMSRLLGISTGRTKAGAFIGSALIISFAGLMEAGTIGSADPTAGPAFLLPAFAAAFLGATAIKVGRFNIWGTMLASIVLYTGVTGLALLGLTGWVHNAFNGVALLLAIIAARITSR